MRHVNIGVDLSWSWRLARSVVYLLRATFSRPSHMYSYHELVSKTNEESV